MVRPTAVLLQLASILSASWMPFRLIRVRFILFPPAAKGIQFLPGHSNGTAFPGAKLTNLENPIAGLRVIVK